MDKNDHDEHFLGSLRSELDEGEESLHPYFVSLNSAADTVRAHYIGWKLRSSAAAQLFQTLKVTDIDGREWTVGAVSGGWFRRDGAKSTWTASMPPVGVTPNLSEVPVWYRDGVISLIAVYLADASTVLQEDSDTRESGAASSGLLAANPFQNMEGGKLDVGTETRNVTTSDTDWLSEEWENAQNNDQANLGTDKTPGHVPSSEEFSAEKLFLPPEDTE